MTEAIVEDICFGVKFIFSEHNLTHDITTSIMSDEAKLINFPLDVFSTINNFLFIIGK